MKISEQNEGTSFPFWVIIDPRQNFKTDNQGLHNIASMVTGVWLSREAAQEFLDRTRYNFSEHARVFCHSGCYSQDWIELSKELNKQIKMKNEIEEIKDLIEQAQERLAKLEAKPIEPLQPEFKAGDFLITETGAKFIVEKVEGIKFYEVIGKLTNLGITISNGYVFTDNESRHMTEAEKAEFLEMIKKAGYQYNAETNTCTKLRWRAGKGGEYWYANSLVIPYFEMEDGHAADYARYNAGNYFQTENECQAFCDKVKELVK